MMSWFAIVVIVAFLVVMRLTRTGRAFYATGGNPVAAVYTGIDVGTTQFIAFCISGTIAGFCGYLWASRYTIAYVEIAGGFELEVIASCVIGGVSIAGGIGTVPGAVLGALFLGVVKNALPVIHVSPFWQLAISGAAILGAVIINSGRERQHRPPHPQGSGGDMSTASRRVACASPTASPRRHALVEALGDASCWPWRSPSSSPMRWPRPISSTPTISPTPPSISPRRRSSPSPWRC